MANPSQQREAISSLLARTDKLVEGQKPFDPVELAVNARDSGWVLRGTTRVDVPGLGSRAVGIFAESGPSVINDAGQKITRGIVHRPVDRAVVLRGADNPSEYAQAQKIADRRGLGSERYLEAHSGVFQLAVPSPEEGSLQPVPGDLITSTKEVYVD